MHASRPRRGKADGVTIQRNVGSMQRCHLGSAWHLLGLRRGNQALCGIRKPYDTVCHEALWSRRAGLPEHVEAARSLGTRTALYTCINGDMSELYTIGEDVPHKQTASREGASAQSPQAELAFLKSVASHRRALLLALERSPTCGKSGHRQRHGRHSVCWPTRLSQQRVDSVGLAMHSRTPRVCRTYQPGDGSLKLGECTVVDVRSDARLHWMLVRIRTPC